MAYAMYLAGMDVKDIHMTDLVSGREDLEDVNMIVFVGGFSNSDVPGSAKGWAGVFRYNEKAKITLENFYKRDDTLSLGIWVAHGEGKFSLPEDERSYHIPVKFTRQEYPGNPNGSDYSAAAICSDDGRHLAMMPHLERDFLPWQFAFYPAGRKNDQVTPWIEAFVNARKWIDGRRE